MITAQRKQAEEKKENKIMNTNLKMEELELVTGGLDLISIVIK